MGWGAVILAVLIDVRSDGVTLTAAPHGTLKLEGRKPSNNLRAQLVRSKERLLTVLTLADRLERGWTLCEQATGAECDRLETYWIALLHECEALMDARSI